MEPNMIVKYSKSAGFITARTEVHNFLTKFGDQKSDQELLGNGFMAVETELKPRELVEELRELRFENPSSFAKLEQLIPIDNWIDADKIIDVIKEDIKDLIREGEMYSIEVYVHSGNLDDEKLIEELKGMIKGNFNLDFHQKLLRIDTFESKAAVTLMKPKDVFS